MRLFGYHTPLVGSSILCHCAQLGRASRAAAAVVSLVMQWFSQCVALQPTVTRLGAPPLGALHHKMFYKSVRVRGLCRWLNTPSSHQPTWGESLICYLSVLFPPSVAPAKCDAGKGVSQVLGLVLLKLCIDLIYHTSWFWAALHIIMEDQGL